jgi:rifampicin phosphotransferase
MTPLPMVSLSDAQDVARYGGKASNLARLLSFGAPVPDGFVIPHGGINGQPVDLDRLLPILSDGPVVVRSSAIGEDSEDASFAGQLDSVCNVVNPFQLRAAIARVHRSQESERVLAYQALRQKPLSGMGIIVQRQVPAAMAGVLFTESPTNPREMLLEYCGGLGEALVSGAINPGRVAIDRTTLTWTVLASPDEPVACDTLLLNDAAIRQLAELAMSIERAFGRPQDIEWAMDVTGEMWIVQSRPITSPGSKDRAYRSPQVFSNANVNENFPTPISPLLYSIARVGYYHYFRNLGRAFGIAERRLRLMEPALRQIIAVHGARMYYNLTSIHGCLRSAPFGDLLSGSFNQFVGAEEPSAQPVGAAYRLRQAGELAAIGAKTAWQYAFLTSRVEDFERTADAYATATRPDQLAGKSLHALVADFRGFLEIRYHRWTNASLADAAAMVCYGLLQRLLARAFPARDQQALHNTLLKALPNLVSGVPALKLWDLSRLVRDDRDLRSLFTHASAPVILDEIRSNPQFSRFRDAFDAFLDQWGFRCSAELMLTSPSFQEDPAPAIDLLKSYVGVDGESPYDLLKRQEAERHAATREVLSTLRRRSIAQWLAARTILAWTQRAIQLRERARLKQALLYSRLRRVSLAIGARLTADGRLSAAEDIFFLTAEEVDLLASGGEMFPDHVGEVVAVRRRAHQDVTATMPPDSFEVEEGQYWVGDGAPKGMHYDGAPNARHHEHHLTGVAACGGETTARAAILLDVTESQKLTAGDVLVTRQTDPGWGPIFPLISGLVIERGGMLSHGAIIAREFGIPSVVGVKDATRRIPHGGVITVDGNRGVVRIAGQA